MNPIRSRLFFALAWCLPAAATSEARAAEPIGRIGDVRSLTSDDAAKSLPVQVRGVVTWRGLREQLIIQDDTGGCWLEMSEARARRLWTGDDALFDVIRVGDVLEISGVSGRVALLR